MFLGLRQAPGFTAATLLAATVFAALKFGAGSGVVEDQIRRVAENPPAAEVPEVVSLPPRAERSFTSVGRLEIDDKEPVRKPVLHLADDRSERTRSIAPGDLGEIRVALDPLEKGDVNGAQRIARKMKNKAEGLLVDWMIATSGQAGIASEQVLALANSLKEWPGQKLLNVRYEQALVREDPGADEVIGAFRSGKPITARGTILLAKALAAEGQQDSATQLIRGYWKNEPTTEAEEKLILKAFGSHLTEADHRTRVDRLLYRERTKDALRAARFLDERTRALVSARIAVIKRTKDAGKLLDKVRAENLWISRLHLCADSMVAARRAHY